MSLSSFITANPLFAGSAVGSLGTLAGGVANAIAQTRINRENIAFQREINDLNYQRQLDMWKMTNEYNSPASQMQRYLAAGLNPNLIYGQSNTASMANVGNAQAQQMVAPNFDFLGTFMNQILSGIQGQQNMKNTEQDITRKKIENFILENTKDNQIEISNKNLDMLTKNLTIIGYQIEDRDIDKAIKTAESTIKTLEAEIKGLNVEYDKQFYVMGLPPDLDPQYAVLFSMLGSLFKSITGKALNFKEIASFLGNEVQNAIGTTFK